MSNRQSSSFTTTQWSMILKAGNSGDPDSQKALELLCQKYWRPVYGYIRHRGYDKDTTEDLTQAFFSQLLEKRSFKTADPKRGKFRSFLLASARNFISDSLDRERARKRGGGRSFISLDLTEAEKFHYEPAHQITPETVYERQWATSVLREVFIQLRQEAIKGNALKRYERLVGFLTGELEGIRQSQVAAELGIDIQTLKVAVHRLRKRFGKILREQVAQTMADPDQVDDEIRYLLSVFNSM